MKSFVLNLNQFVKKIKEKKEFSSIADLVILRLIKEKSLSNKISTLSAAEQKTLLKEIRAELRFLSGQYRFSSKDQTLNTHTSTLEREQDYSLLLKLIKSLNPKSILDLGCGLNPLVISKKFPKVTYHASDINESDLILIKNYFNSNKIKGKTFVYDLQDLTKPLPKVDLCLLLKVLDVVDKNDHKISENILRKVKAKNFIVSFATRKLSGKKMNRPKRIWFEKMIQRLNFSSTKEQTQNECFYILTPRTS